MGRASLFLCGGFAIILGIIQLNVQNSQVSQTKLNVDYVNQTQARNMASSGLHIGIKEIMENGFGWRPETRPWEVTFNGYTVDVYIDDHDSDPDDVQDNQIRVKTESVIDGHRGSAYAMMQNNSSFLTVPGAMGFYGKGSKLEMKGNSKVSGCDRDPPGAQPGEGIDKAGIASVISRNDLMNSGNFGSPSDPCSAGDHPGGGNKDPVRGNPVFCEADECENELDPEELYEKIQEFSQQAELFSQIGAVPPLGTRDTPKIVKIDKKIEKFNDIGGAGILIIPPNHTLKLRGNFVFEGLVIVQGTVDIKGTVEIYGSMLFGDNSIMEMDDVDPEGAFSGNATIQYSSSALTNVEEKLSQMGGKGVIVTSIYD